jgi:hypothetical protein
MKEIRINSVLIVFFPVVRQLSKCLKRRTSVNHLFHAAMLMMTSSEEQVYEQLNEVKTFESNHKITYQ